MTSFRKISLAVVLLVCASAQADTLLLEGITMNAPSASERPQRGTSMANVEARFGAPSSRVAAVGEPPISRWEYPSFVVYFEYDHVVHAAIRR